MTSRTELYGTAFADAGGDELVGGARLDYIARFIGAELTESAPGDDLDTEVAYGFESLGLSILREGAPDGEVIPLFERAFRIRSALWQRNDGQPEDLWLLVVSGTLAQRQPELRLLLKRIELPETDFEAQWDEVLWVQCLRSLCLLARKGNSWADVDAATDELRVLAEAQRSAEAEYLHELPSDEITAQHCRLLGLYHVAEALSVLGRYLRTGAPEGVISSLARHSEHARVLLGATRDIALERVGESLEAALTSMARASIWYNTSRLSQAARAFVESLTSDDQPSPVSELWWSQRTALSESLLDPFKAAISVQMPTSAGKTLLAEFAIVQALALNPAGSIAYVVPTRALVNQITRRLRNDLRNASTDGRDLIVEAAVPAFELDPTENGLLSSRPDILVTTPEKLDLLVRARHAAVDDLCLVVVDEAHHIADTQRGPRLELLLATLKHERAQSCRFLLLTPFLPNAEELAHWLGDNDGVAIRLDWTPSEQLRALGHWTRRDKAFVDALELLPSITQPTVWNSATLELGPARVQPDARSRPKMTASLAIRLSEGARGGTLVLTRGPGTSETRALEIAALMQEPAHDTGAGLLDASLDYIAAELGEDYALTRTLPRGVAFHHAGMPPEVRALVEVLLERGVVKVVTGTSTLAQGVNFPLSSVIIETLRVNQGRGKKTRPLRYAEFWNIAGRAGRALKDAVGLVVYPSISKAQDQEFRDYLAGEAVTVVSALADVISTLDESSKEYGLSLVRSKPVLSHFLQYLTHALRVAGYERASSQVEDLLRSSLAFHQLRQGDRSVAEHLVQWCRQFMAAQRNARLIPVADVTGLSLPSIGLLSRSADRQMADVGFWQPENLFGDSLQPLTEVVELLAQVPEMSLAPSDEQGKINPRRVAGILRDWVRGKTLPEIADAWFGSTREDLQTAGRYLFRDLAGQLPWGIGALQLVSVPEEDSEQFQRARWAPALAFYGVDDPAALAMRMVGVPRAAAATLGRHAPEFRSFEEARRWVADRSAEEWESAAQSRQMSGAVVARIWKEVGGTAA